MTQTQLNFERLLLKTGWGNKAPGTNPLQKRESGEYYYAHVDLAYQVYLLTLEVNVGSPDDLMITAQYKSHKVILCYTQEQIERCKLPAEKPIAEHVERSLSELFDRAKNGQQT